MWYHILCTIFELLYMEFFCKIDIHFGGKACSMKHIDANNKIALQYDFREKKQHTGNSIRHGIGVTV